MYYLLILALNIPAHVLALPLWPKGLQSSLMRIPPSPSCCIHDGPSARAPVEAALASSQKNGGQHGAPPSSSRKCQWAAGTEKPPRALQVPLPYLDSGVCLCLPGRIFSSISLTPHVRVFLFPLFPLTLPSSCGKFSHPGCGKAGWLESSGFLPMSPQAGRN